MYFSSALDRLVKEAWVLRIDSQLGRSWDIKCEKCCSHFKRKNNHPVWRGKVFIRAMWEPQIIISLLSTFSIALKTKCEVKCQEQDKMEIN